MSTLTPNSNIKIYFVKFTDKTTNHCFYKFGITHHYDVLKRFDDAQYNQWDISVMASAYGPRNKVEALEKTLLTKYPKNLWIEQKISGVTEIVALSGYQVHEAIDEIKKYRSQWYNDRKSK